jgi:hypothetical protein
MGMNHSGDDERQGDIAGKLQAAVEPSAWEVTYQWSALLAAILPTPVLLYALGMYGYMALSMNESRFPFAVLPSALGLLAQFGVLVFYASLFGEARGFTSTSTRRWAATIAALTAPIRAVLVAVSMASIARANSSAAGRTILQTIVGVVLTTLLCLMFARYASPIGRRLTSGVAAAAAIYAVYGLSRQLPVMVQTLSLAVGRNSASLLLPVAIQVLNALSSVATLVLLVTIAAGKPGRIGAGCDDVASA